MSTPRHLRKNSRLSGALLLAIAQAILLGLGYITHILIGKLGGPSLYGVYGITLSVQTILNMLLTLGVPVAVSKEVAEDEDNGGSIFAAAVRAQTIIVVLLCGGTMLFARPLALLFGDESLVPIIQFTAIIYPFNGLYPILTNYFNGLHAFALQAGLIVLYAIVKLGGSVGLLQTFAVRGALAGFAIGSATAGIIGFFFALPTLRRTFQRHIPLRRLITFAGAFVGTSIALQILMSTDLFLVKRLLHDDVLAGFYNAAVTLARIPYFILQALGFVFLPSVAKLMHENVEAGRTFIRTIFRYLFLLLLPVTVLSAATSKSLLILFFSSEYIPASRPLTLLMIALGLLSAFYLLATIAAGAGKPRVPLLISWTLVPLSIAFCSFFIPQFALEGAALSTMISSAVGTTAIGIYMYRRFKITFPLRTLFSGIVATVIMVAPTYLIKPAPLWLPVEFLVLGTVYFFVLLSVGEITKDDLVHVRFLLPKGKSLPTNEPPLE